MINLNINENNVTREMALQNGQRLLDEKAKLKNLEKKISAKKMDYNTSSYSLKDLMYSNKLIAIIVILCSGFVDFIYAVSTMFFPNFLGAISLIFEISLGGWAIAGIMTFFSLYNEKKLNKMKLAFEKELEELVRQKVSINDNINALEKVPHIANSMDLIQFDEKEIIENIKKEIEALKESQTNDSNKVMEKTL